MKIPSSFVRQKVDNKYIYTSIYFTTKHKRNVSELKKKMVAAAQQWLCNQCLEVLHSSYEVDHIIELWEGGSNHISNLQALCRNCHGEKTMQNKLKRYSMKNK